jgi:CheY-like chemotaxis protein
MEPEAKPITKISILFVEDDEFVLELQAFALSAKYPEIDFYTAINGNIGLGLFKTHMPEIVLTDINMSGMGGMQMTENIRAVKPDTKFIAITGKASENGGNRKLTLRDSTGKNIEFNHIIVKPVDMSELFAAVDQCIGEIAAEIPWK